MTRRRTAVLIALAIALPLAACWSSPPQRPLGVPADTQAATVLRIIDGDTLDVLIDRDGELSAGVHRVRLLAIDTPETVAPEQPVECGGADATAFAEQLLPPGSTVWLQADREPIDDYGRALRYLWTADGTFLNEEIVRRGLARVVLFEPNDRHLGRLQRAEDAARARDQGIWGPPCDLDGE